MRSSLIQLRKFNKSMLPKTFEHSIEGLATGKTIFFLHGWPDGPELWDHQVESLSSQFRCVRLTLPNFGSRQFSQGFDFPDLLEQLFQTIQEVQRDRLQEKVVLVGHDWGAYLCYLYEDHYPNHVERMVTFDVGAQITPDHLLEGLTYLAYQGWLISAWLLGKSWPRIGTWMSRSLALAGNAPEPQKTNKNMNYLYYYFWRDLLFKSSSSVLLKDYRPHCPTLFLYGRNKPVMFHSQSWEDLLNRTKGCRALEIPNSGHWVMRDQPELTNQLVESWLRKHKMSEEMKDHWQSF
jgi:pimeloyl-ACP methyl ester carboxylesterase